VAALEASAVSSAAAAAALTITTTTETWPRCCSGVATADGASRHRRRRSGDPLPPLDPSLATGICDAIIHAV